MIWLSLAFVYYGIGIMLPTITAKIKHYYPDLSEFTILLMAFSAEVPSNFVAAYVIEKKSFGRKFTLAISYFLCAVAGLLSFLLPEDSLFISLAFVQFFINICYLVVYPYTSELYPTQLRAKGKSTKIISFRMN